MNDEGKAAGQGDGPVVLITGGAGFLGTALVRELRREGGPLTPREIRTFDLHRPEDDEGLVVLEGDLRSPEAVRRACRGVDLVFHAGALIDWGQHPEAEVESINIDGTRNVIGACREAGVGALVHTSTLDVVYTGQPIHGGDESLPVPERPVNVYCRSKAIAEQLALEADGAPLHDEGQLRVVALRPSCIWGEGDPYHATALVEMGRKGPVMRIGDGSARCQHLYVGNGAHAHALAGRALLDGAEGVAGEVFFLTDYPAQNFFDYMQPIVEGAGYKLVPWSRSLPQPLMYGLGVGAEELSRLLRPIWRFTPLVSRFSVNFVCQDFVVETDKAERAFGYRPLYTEEEAFARTIADFRLREEQRSAGR